MDFKIVNRVNAFALVLFFMLIGLKVGAKEYESPIYTQYVSEVTSLFVKEMYKEHGFECGASGGEMPYDIEEISVKLVAYQSVTVEEARELIIKATERFAQIINAHEKIRPFLREYPFPPGRADVSMSFRDPKKKKNPSNNNYVTFVLQAKKNIIYQVDDPINPYIGKNVAVEPYEEALKIVQDNAAKKRLVKNEEK